MENIPIIIREASRDVVCSEIIEGILKPEQVDNIVDFDIINAISELITDHVNSNLSDEAYDEHGRLLFNHSFQSNSRINDIPLVNLYINFLLKLIEYKCKVVRVPLWPKGKKCAIGLSHDVDNPDKYSFLRAPLFLKLKPIKGHIKDTLIKIRDGAKYLTDKERDNFWLFNNIMSLEEKYGFKSTFFFASVNAFSEYGSDLDVTYNIEDEKYRMIFNEILKRKFEIGLHASYLAYKSGERFKYEKRKLEEITEVKVTGLRHHYWHLGRDEQRTLRLHESAGFEYDSSIAFNELMGFRHNIALPYYPWNEDELRKLNVIQLPVFCMDGNLFYQPIEVDTAIEKLRKIVSIIKQFGGIGVIDWHVRTSYPVNSEFINWGKCYVRFIEYLSNDSEVWVNSLGNINDWLRNQRSS
jgi:peptidoglycan/xylan/chitin deacetylase (PgdA/CDA1 family)